MSEGAAAVPATEAAMREAWNGVCMMEYRITGDMMKATACADQVEKTYRENVRAEVLAEVENRIRAAAAGRPGTGLCPEISTARCAADLVARMRSES